ncbi:MAG: lysylphosphatidylglycerol synthase transmembrane domain-containing protein, partial [Tepidisphaeraceae bacterium]
MKFTLRWGIAVAGIFYVVKNISLHDQVIIPDAAGHPVLVRLVNTEVDEDGRSFTVLDPSQGGRVVTLERTQLLSRADRDKATIRDPRTGAPRKVDVLALKVTDHPDRSTWPLVVGEPRGLVMKYFNRWPDAPPIVVEPSAVVEPSPYRVQVPYPLIDRGLGPMVARADRTFLLAAILIFPLTYLITSYRWHVLLEALDVRMRMARAFAINMVGAFYNTFMPGSTGGDVLKAYYAAKQAPNQRTRAVMSVVVDRAIGLLALIMLGGAMAAYQFFRINNPADPTARACRQVAVGSAAILVLVVVGLSVFYHPDLKRLTGLDWLIKRLPMQKQVHKALDAMDAYRRRPVLVF